jgi:hypothetical protein
VGSAECAPPPEKPQTLLRLQQAPEFHAELDVVNKYVSRGLVAVDDPVLQPCVGMAWGGFDLCLWGNLDTTDYGAGRYNNREWRFSETDVCLTYSHTFSKDVHESLPTSLELGGGARYENYDGTQCDDTVKLLAWATLPDLPVTPTLAAEWDADETHGLYLNFSVEHSIPLIKGADGKADPLCLVLGAGIGWGDDNQNEADFGVSSQRFSDAGVAAKLVWALTEHVQVAPFVRYTDFVSNPLRQAAADANDNGSSEQFVYGLNLSFAL